MGRPRKIRKQETSDSGVDTKIGPLGPLGEEANHQRIQALRQAADESGLSADAVRGVDGPQLLKLLDDTGFEVGIQGGVFFAFCRLAGAASAASEAWKRVKALRDSGTAEPAAIDIAQATLIQRLEAIPEALDNIKQAFRWG